MTPTAELSPFLTDEVAATVVQREFERHPELEQRYGEAGRGKALQDAKFHLSFLNEALAADDPSAFREYVAWVKVVLQQRRVRVEDLAFHLGVLAEVLREQMPAPQGERAAQIVTDAVDAIDEMPDDLPTVLRDRVPLSMLAHRFSAALLRGDRATASKLVLDAVADRTPVRDIYLYVFQPSQYEIGRLWQTNRITVAQEHYCTAATQLVMSQLSEHVFASAKNGQTMVATSVAGNLHELGIRMVADFFEMEGWDSYYLGADVPNEAVIASVFERHASVLAVSATLPTQVGAVRELIGALRANDSCRGVRVLVGGRPFSRDHGLWRAVGADGYASSALGGVNVARELVESHA